MGIKDSVDIIYYPNGEKKEMIWDYEVNRNYSSSFKPDNVFDYYHGVDYISIGGKRLNKCFDECYEKNIKVNLENMDYYSLNKESRPNIGFPVKYKPIFEEIKIYGYFYKGEGDTGFSTCKLKTPIVFHPLKDNQLRINEKVFNKNQYSFYISMGDSDLDDFIMFQGFTDTEEYIECIFIFEITKMKFCAVPQYYDIYDKEYFSSFYKDEELAEKYFPIYCELMKDIVKYKKWKFVIDEQKIKESTSNSQLVFDFNIDFARTLFNMDFAKGDVFGNSIGRESEIIIRAEGFSRRIFFESDRPYEAINRIMVHPYSGYANAQPNQTKNGGTYSTPYERIQTIHYSNYSYQGQQYLGIRYICPSVEIAIHYDEDSPSEFIVECIHS